MSFADPAIVFYSIAPRKIAAFYGKLGWTFVKERHDGGPEHYACDHGGFVIEIYPAAQRFHATGAMAGSRMVIPVRDLDAALKAVSRSGEVLVGPKATTVGRSALVADPDGRHVLLIERRDDE